MIIRTVELHQTRAEVGADIGEDLTEQVERAPVSTPRRYLVTKTKCTFSAEIHMPTSTVILRLSYRPTILVGMQRRYRYRLYPNLSQQADLARAFGCARVVWNDGLRLRQDAYEAGRPYVSDVDVQRAVITAAKRTPERAWLAEVSSVVLVQSVNDLHRAYRNYFNDLARVKAARASGNKAKLGVRRPRFKTKHDDQAVRLTRNGFAVRPNGWLYVAKVGDIKVRWSRPLSAVPSSVTVTRDGAGRYHASFVVEVAAEPLPAIETAVGLDLGLACFAALSTGEQLDNPRWLRTRQARLRRAQRALSRKQNGSANRAKARRKVARLHAQVADARRDFHHQLSTRLIRENQAVCVETLNVAGLGRSNLAKSIHDAGWGQFTRMLVEKADRHGRTLVKVDQWYPSSQLCSACGVKDGPKPLKVRAWTCTACGAAHDRDINAALNLLAAGRAVAACGPGVRPPARAAVGKEAGTTRGAAA
jgi:IS605 OrfB family transposase